MEPTIRYHQLMASRSEMDMALKAITLPRLRSAGFTGSFPHLRRVNNDEADLITFQFNLHGGSFVAEIAKCHAEGIHSRLGLIPASKAKAWDRHPNDRLRIHRTGSEWFDFLHEHPNVLAEAAADKLLDDAVWLAVSPDGSETPYLKR